MKIEMIGKTFGDYTVLSETDSIFNQSINYICKCKCGKLKKINGTLLRNGKEAKCRHQEKHGLSYHKLYKVYYAMLERCYKKNFKQFKDYGERGIKVCSQWKGEKGFLNFFNWAIDNGYKNGLQIDRIDNNKGYCEENCRFVTHFENSGIGKQRMQSNNTTGFVGVSKSGEKYRAYITFNKKRIHIGSNYKTIKEALEARIKKEIELLGEQKTNLNILIEVLDDSKRIN